MTPKPKLAVWKFSSCDGCQLSLLDCEDELLAVAERVQIAYFLEATSSVVEGPYDVSLVEGSITTPHDAERIHEVRAASRVLITIGACASAGGIQALRNFADVDRADRGRLRNPGLHHDPVDLDPDQRARAGRLRAAGMPDRQGSAAGAARRAPERPPAADSGSQRLRRVQAARDGLRDGRGRHAVSGAGHPRRLRCALPRLRPRLLRLLRAEGDAEPGVAERVVRPRGPGSRAAVSDFQRGGARLPGGERSS